ncbi:MAG: AMP-binding protein [Deltaproteobacteria bacterium]|nr:AMP-binding protein [Deltaproteobacteria bacterium]
MIDLTLGDLYDRCVQYYGRRTAITFNDISVTYSQIGEKAERLRSAFQALGLKKGDKVAFLMANCPEYIFCESVAAKNGYIKIPLAVLLGSDDHVYMMNLTECKALVYHEKMTKRVLEMAPRLETVTEFVCMSEDPMSVPDGHHSLKNLMETHTSEPDPVKVTPDDLTTIIFTGGTTGKPKGVMLSHRAIVNTVLMQTLEFGFGWHEVFAYLTPLTHAGGALLLPVLLRGGRCVVLDHFDPKGFLEAVEREKVTAVFLVPTMIYVLLDYPNLKKYDVSSLRNIIYGASAIAPERLKQAMNTFGPIFTQLFGQTEAPMVISALPREEHVVADPDREREILGSAGRPACHTLIKIIGDDGKPVADGESGEIVVQCSNMMDGYYKNPDATADTLVDGWLHTGDIGRIDHEGFLYIVDRKKDMIVSGGFNIFPREIEDVLFEHPAVKGAAVIGVPHEKWGEEVKAVVVLHEGESVGQDDLISFVKARKGSMMAPKTVEFRDEIPLTNLGKPDKKQIRAEYWKGKDRLVS